jgi:hypothetical protein
MNQGPREDCLMKKTEGRKSRDFVHLNKKIKSISIRYRQYIENERPAALLYPLPTVIKFFRPCNLVNVQHSIYVHYTLYIA